jgi:hypothetical protein
MQPFFCHLQMNKKALLFLLTLVAFTQASAQDYYRFKADFSIKEKFVGEEKGQLITGTVFFDNNTKKVCHDIRFPARERWINHDTFMYRFVSDTFVSKRGTLPFAEFSMYKMILSQQLGDFGLDKGGYTLAKVENGENGQTTSTWAPQPALKELIGNVVIVQEKKQVAAVALYSPTDSIQAKYYLKDYQLVEGLPVPTKIYQIFYFKDGREQNRIITYKNVVINQEGEDEIYDFRLPDTQ